MNRLDDADYTDSALNVNTLEGVFTRESLFFNPNKALTAPSSIRLKKDQ